MFFLFYTETVAKARKTSKFYVNPARKNKSQKFSKLQKK